MEAVVLHRVGVLEHFCPKQGQDFKPSAAPIYSSVGKVPPSPPRDERVPKVSAKHFLNKVSLVFRRISFWLAAMSGILFAAKKSSSHRFGAQATRSRLNK